MAGRMIRHEAKPPQPEVIVSEAPAVGPRRKLWQAMFFTKEGSLDLGWLILLTCCIVGLTVFVASSVGAIKGPSVAGWAWFGSFTAMAFIAGAARDRAVLIAQSRVPGEVAQGIAQSGSHEYGPNTESLE